MPPAARPFESGDQAQQRRLAASGPAKQADHLAARGAERDALEHGAIAVAVRQVGDVQVERCCHFLVGASRILEH
jgi:hypothetical protein